DVLAGGRTLQAVQADGAEHQLVTAVGDVRTGGGGGDHEDAFILVDVGGRLGGTGAKVADHEADACVDDTVGHGDRLLWIAGVIEYHTLQLAAVDAAGLVDHLDGHVGAGELHVAILRHRPGNWTGQCDLDGV